MYSFWNITCGFDHWISNWRHYGNHIFEESYLSTLLHKAFNPNIWTTTSNVEIVSTSWTYWSQNAKFSCVYRTTFGAGTLGIWSSCGSDFSTEHGNFGSSSVTWTRGTDRFRTAKHLYWQSNLIYTPHRLYGSNASRLLHQIIETPSHNKFKFPVLFLTTWGSPPMLQSVLLLGTTVFLIGHSVKQLLENASSGSERSTKKGKKPEKYSSNTNFSYEVTSSLMMISTTLLKNIQKLLRSSKMFLHSTSLILPRTCWSLLSTLPRVLVCHQKEWPSDQESGGNVVIPFNWWLIDFNLPWMSTPREKERGFFYLEICLTSQLVGYHELQDPHQAGGMKIR